MKTFPFCSRDLYRQRKEGRWRQGGGQNVGIDNFDGDCHRRQQHRQDPSEEGHYHSSPSLFQAQGMFPSLPSILSVITLSATFLSSWFDSISRLILFSNDKYKIWNRRFLLLHFFFFFLRGLFYCLFVLI